MRDHHIVAGAQISYRAARVVIIPTDIAGGGRGVARDVIRRRRDRSIGDGKGVSISLPQIRHLLPVNGIPQSTAVSGDVAESAVTGAVGVECSTLYHCGQALKRNLPGDG